MLRFTPDGRVLVCCANDQHALGVIGTDSLREIWDGEERARIAEALDRLDYSLGCDECGAERSIGNRAGSIEAFWDHLAPAEPLRWPSRLEMAISNTCNLQCIQCNGDRSSAIRSQR
jgi:MoaA/NifB/PqqE/SkfB family radical SAM enzyme